MVVAEALDFPGAVTQGFDLADARLMIASAMEDLAQCLLEEGMPGVALILDIDFKLREQPCVADEVSIR